MLLVQNKNLNQKRIDNIVDIDNITPNEMAKILTTVLRVMKVSQCSFFSKSRVSPLPLCRQLVSYFAHLRTAETLEKIGTVIGGGYKSYDHATVLHGVKKINDYIEVSKPIRAVVAEINLLLT